MRRPLSRVGPVDPGLQAERTDFAWRRTHLSLVVAALAVARHAAGAPGGLQVAAAGVVAGLAAFLLLGPQWKGVTAGVAVAVACVELLGSLGGR